MTTLAFYRGKGTWRDVAIRQVTGSRYSHVELVGDDGRCISASKRDGNEVRIRTIPFRLDHWTFVTTHHHPAISWLRAVAMIGMPYDTVGATISGGLGIPLHRADAWYCNELMAYALDLPRPWPATPGELFEVLTNANTTGNRR